MDVITHKCPNCGGALTFDPGDQKFHCPFCLSIFTEAEVTAFEQKQKEAQLADGTAPENHRKNRRKGGPNGLVPLS